MVKGVFNFMKLFDAAMKSIVQAFLRSEQLRLECNAVFYQPERPVCSRPTRDNETTTSKNQNHS